ncbi:MAG TPA: glycosyltransferase family 2 protein, partial [Spirochaetia bacterium]|nr:glycosyltransferase family 2 protein [Spirochaetia bacterium]
MNNDIVSIIVPTYNRRNFLPINLKSLLNQTYKNIEIIVVNDYGEDVSDIIN